MGRGKRGSEAPAFFRLVKFYSIKVFENLRFRPSGNEIGSYDKHDPGDHFRKSAFSVPGRRLTGKEKKLCFLKYEDTCRQDQSQLSVARVPILCFRNPCNTLCLPPLPLQKRNRINYCFQMLLLRRTAYSLDQEHLKTTTYAKFRGVNRLYYKGLKLLYNISMTYPRMISESSSRSLTRYTVEPLQKGHLGDRRKWPVVERWPSWGGKGVIWQIFVRGVRHIHACCIP